MSSVIFLYLFGFNKLFTVLAISNPDDRTVNIAIETSFQFEPKDINNEKGIITNIKSFIDKIYRSLEPAASPYFRQTPDKITLSTFLRDFGMNVLNLTDEHVLIIVKTLNNHFQEYKTSKTFHSIFSDSGLKKHITKTVHNWANLNAKELKKKLEKLIKDGNPDLQKVTSQLNTLYNKQDLDIFYNYNKKLNKYLRKKKNVYKLIKEWLDFSILERYSKLNASSKVKVKDIMISLSDYFTGNTRLKTQDDSNDSLWSKHEEDVSGSDGYAVHKHYRHSHLLKSKKNSRRNKGKTVVNEEDDKNKTTIPLNLFEKFFNNDVLGNLEVYLSNTNKTKYIDE